MAQRGRKSPNEIPPPPRVDFEPHPVLPPPSHLSSEMKEWWLDVTGRFALEAHDYKLLEAACDAWDLMRAANEVIRREGLTFIGQRGPRARPEVAIAREARLGFSRLVRALKLDTDDHAPRVGGYGVAYDRLGNRQ